MRALLNRAAFHNWKFCVREYRIYSMLIKIKLLLFGMLFFFFFWWVPCFVFPKTTYHLFLDRKLKEGCAVPNLTPGMLVLSFGWFGAHKSHHVHHKPILEDTVVLSAFLIFFWLNFFFLEPCGTAIWNRLQENHVGNLWLREEKKWALQTGLSVKVNLSFTEASQSWTNYSVFFGITG